MATKQRAFFAGKRPRIEIIPMIDIMMFLLVFFIMITLKMIASSTLKLELPGAATADPLPETRVLIGVQNDGLAAIDGIKMSRADIQTVLKRTLAASRKVNVEIAGDKEVSAELLVDTMKMVQEAGINSVGIVARSSAVPK
jgi:biopolymer transport protein ExbD